MARVLVLYYSAYGHIEAMANAVAEGAKSAGAEVVVCVEGSMTLIQEIGGEEVRTTLGPGEYAINPPGVWHTADVSDHATGFFVTPGVGTQGRPR